MTRRTPKLTADELARAIAGEAIVTRYQPKVRFSDRLPVGVETLARLRHPRLGLVGPEQFVPLAERAGLAPMLTAAVTRRAVADIAAVRAEGLDLTVALNFPLEILALPEIPESLARDVEEGGLSPQDVIVELTETQARDDLEVVARVTERLIARGFGVSLDDFGLGGAPHRHVSLLRFTEIKLDQGLVLGALTDPMLATGLDTAIAIGRAMQLTVVAEGVETPAVWEMLQQKPVDQAQGWLVGRPMLAEELAGWAEAWLAG
jgi:EAL domain-containing protein (putative c-di-GMP-specific phosphodiesterase class I)